jgi:hypothetical protein
MDYRTKFRFDIKCKRRWRVYLPSSQNCLTEYPHISLENVQDKFVPTFRKNVPPPASDTKWVDQPPPAFQSFQQPPRPHSIIMTKGAAPYTEMSEEIYDRPECNNTQDYYLNNIHQKSLNNYKVYARILHVYALFSDAVNCWDCTPLVVDECVSTKHWWNNMSKAEWRTQRNPLSHCHFSHKVVSDTYDLMHKLALGLRFRIWLHAQCSCLRYHLVVDTLQRIAQQLKGGVTTK